MKRTSKRVIAFFLILVLVLSLCACAQKQQAGTDEPNRSADGETLSGMPDQKTAGKAAPGGRGIGYAADTDRILRGSGTISCLAAGENGFSADPHTLR